MVINTSVQHNGGLLNVSVQYNGGLLPDIIMLTQCYFHREPV